MRRTLCRPMFRCLSLEALERREVLSGNVVAAVDASGLLVITGDNLANNIVISAGANPGEVTVSGGTAGGVAGTETTVNGSLDPVTVAGVGGAARLSMQGGSDQVLITNLRLEGSLEADLGAGHDRLSVQSNKFSDTTIVLNNGGDIAYGPARLGVFASVSAGDGDDTLSIRNVKIAGYLALTAGAGNDTFIQAGAVADNNRVGGTVSLQMGDGTDAVRVTQLKIFGDLNVDDPTGGDATVRIDGAKVTGSARIKTPNGSDTISLGVDGVASAFVSNKLVVNSQQGFDDIALRNVATLDLVINAGAGNNNLTLDHVSARETLTITAGSGADTLSLTAVVADLLVVRTWRGNDSITLQRVSAADGFFDLFDGADEMVLDASVFSQLSAFFGFDDDELTFGNLTVVGTAEFNGGEGLNTSANLGGNDIGRLKLVGFINA